MLIFIRFFVSLHHPRLGVAKKKDANTPRKQCKFKRTLLHHFSLIQIFQNLHGNCSSRGLCERSFLLSLILFVSFLRFVTEGTFPFRHVSWLFKSSVVFPRSREQTNVLYENLNNVVFIWKDLSFLCMS